MTAKQKRVPRMQGLIEYIELTQQSFDRSIALAQTAQERRDERTACDVMLWEADTSQKYFLTSSALAMIAQFMPKHSVGVRELPGTGIWMTLEDLKSTNLYFSSIPHAASSYAEYHPHVKMSRRLEQLAAAGSWLWNLEIIAIENQPLSYLYDAERGRWTLNNIDLCPTGRCEKTGVDQKQFPGWYMCEVCEPIFRYWTAWFPVALMAVNLDFAETEDRPKTVLVTEREMRKKRTERGYKETPVSHQYRVITFNISVKPNLPPIRHPDKEEPTHPTWLEQAIQENAVLYVDKHIGQTQRTFFHERYINMRGKTINVRPYEKRVPRSIRGLKQTIYQAVAKEGQKGHI